MAVWFRSTASPEQRDRLEHPGLGPGDHPGADTAQADDGWFAPQVAEALDWSRARCTGSSGASRMEAGLEGVLQDRPQAQRYRKLDDRGEAHLIALACSPAPEGHDHWTLRLLAGKVVELGLAPALYETVRQRLKKTSSSRGRSHQRKRDFVAHMEDVLDYAEPYDPQRPVVCFDRPPPSCWPDAARSASPAGTPQAAGL